MAEDSGYNIIFHGELVSGADPGQVRQNLAQLFKMDPEKVEKLFAGKPVVLKKNADQATAMKMRAALKKAGAECEMRALDEGDSAPSTAPAASAPAGAEQKQPDGGGAEPSRATGEAPSSAEPGPAEPAAPAGEQDSAPAANLSMTDKPGDLEIVGTIRTGGTSFSDEFEVAPVGAELEELGSDETPVDPDISHLSMAEPGAELEQLQDQEEVEVPDISHLRVVDDTESAGSSG